MDGLQAAVLNVKMPHLAGWNVMRRKAAENYDKLLSGIKDIILPTVREGAHHVYHLYVIRTEQRDQLQAHLAERGIPTVINYPRALPLYSAYDYLGHTPSDFPNAHKDARQILSLPLHPFIDETDQKQLANAIQDFFLKP
jgi:dTDP-4-amino-4,6-dideoxygalactose transaminase